MLSFNQKFIDSLKFTGFHLSVLRQLGEYRGRQLVFRKKSQEVLKTLKQHAMISSVESSNRLEQITAPYKRIKGIVTQFIKPDTRSEKEIAGYKDALSLVHESYPDMHVSVNHIKQLHTILYRPLPEDGGYFKSTDNSIVERDEKGKILRKRFVTVPAVQTSDFMDQLCHSYQDLINEGQTDPLILIPLLILDFLCIHPFKDGNGRISRLLTLLVLYQHGYEVGKYISLERIFEDSKEDYYKTLEQSSQHWHESQHNPFYWIEYFWSVMIRAYKEFESKMESMKHIKTGKGTKTDQIKKLVKNKTGPFAISEIEKDLPHIGKDMIKNVLKQLKADGSIMLGGVGRNAKWINVMLKEASSEMKIFIKERRSKILSNTGPVKLQTNPKLVLHIIPAKFFNHSQALNVQKLNQLPVKSEVESGVSGETHAFDFCPVNTFMHILHGQSPGSWNDKINFDGRVFYSPYAGGRDFSFSYTQVFHNAVIEVVDTYTVAVEKKHGLFLTPQNYEIVLIEALNRYAKGLTKNNIDGSMFVFPALLNVKGYKIHSPQQLYPRETNTPIDRDHLTLPEVYIEDIKSFSAQNLMKPAFDRVWNACAYTGSGNYKNNTWNPRSD